MDPDRTNIVLNGGFEASSYSPGCHFNLVNDDVTANISNVTAWGDANEIDYMNDGSSCGYAGPLLSREEHGSALGGGYG